MQVTGQDAERSILFEMAQPFIRAAVQAVMLQAVDSRFHGRMLFTQRDEGFAMLTLELFLIEIAFLRQH